MRGGEMRVHQIWFDFNECDCAPHADRRRAMRLLNPGCIYHLWSLADAMHFMEVRCPHWLPLFSRLPHNINRCDVFRYVLMLYTGGVYLDLDFVCVRSLSALVEATSDGVLVCEEWPRSLQDATVHNGVLVSGLPGHPLWTRVLQCVSERLDALVEREDKQAAVFKLTGTAMLRDAVCDYWANARSLRSVHVAPHHVFCPLSVGAPHSGSMRVLVSRGVTEPAKEWRLIPATLALRAAACSPSIHTVLCPSAVTWQRSFEGLNGARK